jgi:hypothetical protein
MGRSHQLSKAQQVKGLSTLSAFSMIHIRPLTKSHAIDKVRISDRRDPCSRTIHPRRPLKLCRKRHPSKRQEHHHAYAGWCSALPIGPQGHSTRRPSFVVDGRSNKSYSDIPAKGLASRSSSGDRLEERIRGTAKVPQRNTAPRPSREHGDQGRKIPQPRQGKILLVTCRSSLADHPLSENRRHGEKDVLKPTSQRPSPPRSVYSLC